MATFNDDKLLGVDWNLLPRIAREQNAMREWELRFMEHLRINPHHREAWEVLASLYYEDACYPNCLWILENRLRVSDGEMQRAALCRTALRDQEEWSVANTECPATPDSFDCWEIRDWLLLELQKDTRNADLWYRLTDQYVEAEELLMALWCLMVLAVNAPSSELEGIPDVLRMIDAIRKGSGTFWCEQLQEFPILDIDRMHSLPILERTRLAGDLLNRSAGIRVNLEAVPICWAIQQPSDNSHSRNSPESRRDT